MKVMAWFSEKGGSGKTTLAVHTAVAAQESGLRVTLVDTDPQRSATVWGYARAASEPVVTAVSVSALPRALATAKASGMDLVIVDTAPHAAPEAAGVAKVASLVAIPCRPSAFDLSAASGAAKIVRAARARAIFVLSACPFRAPEIEEARGALAIHGLPIAPMEITDRRAFSRALATGHAVTEFDSGGKAAAEIRYLWTWLRECMDEQEADGARHLHRSQG